MAVPDPSLLAQATDSANQLVIDHDAFGDPELIYRLADFVERAGSDNSPALKGLVAAELRARAAILRTLQQ